MSKLLKLTLTVCVAILATTVLPAWAGHACPHAVQMAENTPCVAMQLGTLRSSALYKEHRVVTDMGPGMSHVDFFFEPKCLNDPIPCRIATICVDATVDCTTGAVACP